MFEIPLKVQLVGGEQPGIHHTPIHWRDMYSFSLAGILQRAQGKCAFIEANNER
jgi:hypothetical protein